MFVDRRHRRLQHLTPDVLLSIAKRLVDEELEQWRHLLAGDVGRELAQRHGDTGALGPLVWRRFRHLAAELVQHRRRNLPTHETTTRAALATVDYTQEMLDFNVFNVLYRMSRHTKSFS